MSRTEGHTFSAALVPVVRDIYENTEANWHAYEECEDLGDLEDNL